MLRLACCLMVERGIELCAPVHDAVLVEGSLEEIDQTVADAQTAMREASAIILGGFELETDADIVRWPNRYSDDRGVDMWTTVLDILTELDPVRFGVTGNQTGLVWSQTGRGVYLISYLINKCLFINNKGI